jgi:hypothetical protein
MKDTLRLLAGTLCILSMVTNLYPQAARLSPAVPTEPIKAILDAFGSHQLVALGEPHGNEQAAAFRIALIRDARFADVVTDIVVESGNSRFQDVVDAFVSGQRVPDTTLRQVWQDTTVANFVWERPIYEQFLRTVREVNASLPKQKQLRLVLGDPPIDWSTVHTADDLQKWLVQRDSSAASIVREQVLAKRRRALVIYGEGHLWRHDAGNNLVSRIEAEGTKVFIVSTPFLTDLSSVQPGISSWPTPSLALLSGTLIGAENFQRLFGFPGTNSVVRYEDQVDAVLYLGAPSAMTTSRLPAPLCADERYVSMRLARMALDPGPPGSPPPADLFKSHCATR